MVRRVGLTLLVGVLAAAAAERDDPADKPPPKEEVVVAGEVFKLEVAADEEARTRGLMGRKEIDEHGGMLFLFKDLRWRFFWMKNCLVDIDLVYLDERGRIVRLHKMKTEPPRADDEPEWAYERRLKRYTSRRPAQFALELKAGSIDRLKLKLGQTIELDLDRLKKMAK
jgi:uncharacterized membrane protein (UPF0127 family)